MSSLEESNVSMMIVQRLNEVVEQNTKVVELVGAIAARITHVEVGLSVRGPADEREHEEFRVAITALTKMVNDHEGMLKWGRWGIAAAIAMVGSMLVAIPMLWKVGQALTDSKP